MPFNIKIVAFLFFLLSCYEPLSGQENNLNATAAEKHKVNSISAILSKTDLGLIIDSVTMRTPDSIIVVELHIPNFENYERIEEEYAKIGDNLLESTYNKVLFSLISPKMSIPDLEYKLLVVILSPQRKIYLYYDPDSEVVESEVVVNMGEIEDTVELDTNLLNINKEYVSLSDFEVHKELKDRIIAGIIDFFEEQDAKPIIQYWLAGKPSVIVRRRLSNRPLLFVSNVKGVLNTDKSFWEFFYLRFIIDTENNAIKYQLEIKEYEGSMTTPSIEHAKDPDQLKLNRFNTLLNDILFDIIHN